MVGVEFVSVLVTQSRLWTRVAMPCDEATASGNQRDPGITRQGLSAVDQSCYDDIRGYTITVNSQNSDILPDNPRISPTDQLHNLHKFCLGMSHSHHPVGQTKCKNLFMRRDDSHTPVCASTNIKSKQILSLI